MPDHNSSDDDSDEELGAYIYSISRTAKLLREEEAATTVRNNELELSLSTNNNDDNDDNDSNNIKVTTPKKSPHKVQNVSVSSHLTSSTITECNMLREKRKTTPDIVHVPSSSTKLSTASSVEEVRTCSKSTSTNNDNDIRTSRALLNAKFVPRKLWSNGGCTNYSTNNDNNNITRPKRKSPHEHEVENNISVSSEQQKRPKNYSFTCNHEGCTNHVVEGGVCMGTKTKRNNNMWSHEGFTNNQVVRNGGSFTSALSQARKTCSYEGFTNYAQRGGVCISRVHGAPSLAPRYTEWGIHQRNNIWSQEGFTNQVRNGGEGWVTNYAQEGGVCRSRVHGAVTTPTTYTGRGIDALVNAMYDNLEGCTNQVQKGGDCQSAEFIGEDDPNNGPPASLHIESDTTFLDNLHNFLRTKCIEIFVVTQHNIDAPGRGSRKPYIGQLGLQCIHCKGMSRKELARQAICYPSKRDTIFEAVRNYHRQHLKICPSIPQVLMDEYKKVLISNDRGQPKHVLKVYYSEAASELGIVDSTTHNGLVYDKSRVNTSGIPSQQLQTIIEVARSSSAKFALLFTPSGKRRGVPLDNNNGPTIDNKLEMRKFEHVCSEATRKVLLAARNEPTVFVTPQDFPTVSDEHYLLFHQLEPIIGLPSLRRSQSDVHPEKVHSHGIRDRCGLACKYCSLDRGGVYYPSDYKALVSRKLS